MNIRTISSTDFSELKRIHEKFYKEEFSFPDFIDKYLCVVVIEDEQGIIAAGGVRTITESVIVTDKSRNLLTKVKALYKMLDMNEFICKQFGYSELHAFIQDNPSWVKSLKKVGFKPTKGNAFVLQLGDK